MPGLHADLGASLSGDSSILGGFLGRGVKGPKIATTSGCHHLSSWPFWAFLFAYSKPGHRLVQGIALQGMFSVTEMQSLTGFPGEEEYLETGVLL